MKQFYRAANISRREAVDSILDSYPDMDLVSLETKTANDEEADLAEVEVGDLVYVATVKQAEFPPKEEGGDDEPADKPADDGPPSPPKSDSEGDDSGSSDDKPSPPKSDGDSDDSSSDGPPKHDGPDGAAPEKMKPEEEMVHLLRQILDAVKGGPGGLGPMDDLGPGGDLDMDATSEIGAPEKGDLLGPGAGAPKPPLPPPVPEPGMGAAKRSPAAFSHYNPDVDEFYSLRKATQGISNEELLKEAAVMYPTHKVAKIQRQGEATVEGETLNLPEYGLALLTLTRSNA